MKIINLYGGGILCHLQYINLSYFPCPDSQFLPIYQRENFNEILIIKASIVVNIIIVENPSQIVHIEDHLMFYNSKLSKMSGY